MTNKYKATEMLMQKWTNTLPLDTNNILIQQIFTEDALFLDIETTGFSPANTRLYLIGCARRQDETMIIEQFFADSKEDEILILSDFLKLLESYKILITFNGTGFDIPYLKAKCNTYHLPEYFNQKDSIDLFKIASSLKFLLKLPNYKQKTIEAFLGIEREDIFDGGQLINIYHEYLTYPSKQQLHFLKQHNYEDVLGMLDLLPVLSYSSLLKGEYVLHSIESNIYTDYDGIPKKELIFSLKNKFPVPKRVSFGYHEFYLSCNGFDTKLSVKLYEGELKYFFKNYHDYYYLPEEDIAVHKNIASSVDKNYRKKATADTCYVRKNSIFLPQYEYITEPAFRLARKDKLSYFELSDKFIGSNEILCDYINHILKLIAKQKH